MKNTKRIITTVMFATLLIFISSCKKGNDGTPGKDGKDGNANIINHTFSINSWSSNSSRYYIDIPIAELTANNINTASVEVYFSKAPNIWIAVPYTYVTSPNNYFMGFLTTIGEVEVTWDCNSITTIGNDPNATFGTTIQIKVVVIPPTQRKANPNVNWKNYNEVKAKFNLKD